MKFQPPRGTRDYIQEEAEKLEKVLEIVRATFRKYGFTPLYTPAFEDFELLSVKGGLGEGVKDEIYYFRDKSDRELGLRFDLTMPMVRVVATNPQLKLPFRRYAIGRVWRYDRPQAMRYREFWQADVDIVGSDSIKADIECVACVCECIEKLGFQEFYVRTYNRKMLESIFGQIAGEDKIRDVFRIIDKIDKIGDEGVKEELNKNGVSEKAIKSIMKYIKIDGTNGSIIKKLKKKYGESEGSAELEEALAIAKDFGVEKRIKIDPSLVRGLDYYTGNVFEVYLGTKLGCGGGGRYDEIIGAVGGRRIPATGISLGISRIVEVMKDSSMFKPLFASDARVFVANVDEESYGSAVKVANKIRSKGFAAETDSMGRKLGKQLEYADSANIRFVVIVGKKEMQSGKLKFKDMKLTKEEELTIGQITSRMRKLGRSK